MKASIIFFLLSLIVILSYPVWAQGARKDATSPGTTRKEAIKEKMATREAALKTKLAAFKDKRKAEITQKISNTLNRINENQTKMTLKFLDRASTILSKLEDRVNRGTPDIKDVAASKAAIALAKESIASTSAAVKAQAEKDYTVTITSERKVKTDLKAVRDRLHADLRAVREQVINAKQAVANAIRVAKEGRPSGF